MPAGITVNKNSIPFETKSPQITSGIRIGTPAVTTRGMKETEMVILADFINRVLGQTNDPRILKTIREEVRRFCRGFPCSPKSADPMDAEGVEPAWNDYFMDIADLVAKRSTCLRRQVGAVAVKEKRILATGYNGVPSGIPHCLDVGCLREQEGIPSGERHELCRGIHAEQNVIIQAAHYGVSIGGPPYTVPICPA